MWVFISTISDLLLVNNIISSSISGVIEVPLGSGIQKVFGGRR
jgi:hypothetical protein